MSPEKAVPSCRGHYLLLLSLPSPIEARIGSLGRASLEPGYYVYVGSAHGPGGLRARLRRHLCGARRRIHWHIDMLIEQGAIPVLALAACCSEWREELLARACASRCRVAVPRFGSSDRPGSPGHLFYCSRSVGEALLSASRCLAEASRYGPC